MKGFQHKALDIVWSQVVWVLCILSVTQVGFCHLPCLQGTLGAQNVLNELQETVFLKYFYKRLCHHLDCVTLDSQPPRMIPGGYHFDFQKKSQKSPHQKLALARQTTDTRGPRWVIFLGTVLQSPVSCYS